MINAKLLEERGVVVLKPAAPLEKADFENLARQVDPMIERAGGTLNGLMVVAPKFPGWNDFAGLVSHLRFVREHHRKIKRVALVTDDKLLSELGGIAKHFVSAEVRQFPSAEEANALTWLGGVSGQNP